MSEKNKEDFAFIKEKIKENPINKKRLLKHSIATVFFAVLFGLVSCLVFVWMRPVMEGWLHPKGDPTVIVPQDQPETEMMPTESMDTEILAEPATETEKIVKQDLELPDYQMLQNKMYDIGRQANRFVVTVTAVKSDMDWYNNAYQSKGQSSGIILEDNGSELLILTEHKVIEGAQEINVTFINDVTVAASLKKFDGNTGLSVLSVDMNLLSDNTKAAISYAVLGDARAVAQGNIVIAVGSPLGNNYSIATGSVTSVDNAISTIDNTYKVFTTDIVGSSGSGALLNLDGEIIGLVMQDDGSESVESTLTAISISELNTLISRLSSGRDIPYIGLKVITVTDHIAKDYEIPLGVFIKEVNLDSPALDAGLQSGDVIVEIDGGTVSSVDAYESKISELHPGDVTTIVVKRQSMNDYSEITFQVTAGQLK